MKVVLISIISIFLLLSSLPVFAQGMISKEDSLKLEQKIKNDLKELHSKERRVELENKSNHFDSLIAQDSLNFWALNQKISLQVTTFELDSAKATLKKLHRRTVNTKKYDFLKATLFDHFGKDELAQELYDSEINELKHMFDSSSSGFEQAESLLGLWYVNRYLGNEAKADSLMSIIRSDYYRYMNIGVDWNFFNKRFGDGIFDDGVKK